MSTDQGTTPLQSAALAALQAAGFTVSDLPEPYQRVLAELTREEVALLVKINQRLDDVSGFSDAARSSNSAPNYGTAVTIAPDTGPRNTSVTITPNTSPAPSNMRTFEGGLIRLPRFLP